MFEIVWNLLSFVVALGILVTVHEYGHYWVAIKNGVKVERFSIGFGKALWRRTNRAGTEFVIAMIPLGGYVKMLDERVDDVPVAQQAHAFNRKSVYQRIAIIAAGPMANFLFAIFAFYLMFIIGLPGVKPIIDRIEPNSLAASANLPVNAQIVAVDGKETLDWNAVNLALVRAIGQDSVKLELKVEDSIRTRHIELDTRNWHFEPNQTSSIASLGIVPFRPDFVVGSVSEAGAAARAGLLVDDRIIAINGENIGSDWGKAVQIIRKSAEQPLAFSVERQGKVLTIDIIPESSPQQDGSRIGLIGVAPKFAKWPDSHRIDLTYGPIDAIGKGIEHTWNMVTLSFQMIGKFITGDVSVKNISGPIGIAQGAGDSAGYGLVYFLSFLALISINLGIINLLPLPVLDGGHLLYYFIELLTGKPVPENVQEVGFKIGAVVLLMLMSLAIFNDLSRLT